MSTFAVFGMTLDLAKTESGKKTCGTRKNLDAPGGVEPKTKAPKVGFTDWPPT